MLALFCVQPREREIMVGKDVCPILIHRPTFDILSTYNAAFSSIIKGCVIRDSFLFCDVGDLFSILDIMQLPQWETYRFRCSENSFPFNGPYCQM